MAEETLWSGRSSQWQNFWPFVLCVLVVPIPWAFWRWLKVKSRVYRLTNERLLVTSGVLTKTTEALELYRVRDLQVRQTFGQRLTGLHSINLFTSDASTPQIFLDDFPLSANLPDLFREHIEKCRMQKRVREVDIE